MSLLDSITSAGSIPAEDAHVKLMVQGRSGAGKSTLGAKMPNPVILLTEANGLPSIRAANPDALVIRIYDPAAYGLSTTFEVLTQGMNLATTRAFDAKGVQSVVADSATEIQRIIKEQILREKGVLKDLTYVMTQQDWGLLTERTRRWARAFRDLPYHTLMITLSTEERDDEGKITMISPSFEGKKLPQEILQFCSAGGFAFKRPRKDAAGKLTDDVDFEVLFQGPSMYVVKPVVPLRNVETDDPSDWISRIVAHKPGDAPLPSLAAIRAAAATPPPESPEAKTEGSAAAPTAPAKAAPAASGAAPTRRTAAPKKAEEQDPTKVT
jgi:hypothetical protein